MIGKIVLVSYIIKVPKKISEESKQKVLLQNTSTYIQKFLMDAAFNPAAAADPSQLYSTSRNDTHKMIDGIESGDMQIKKMYIQYGQKESINDVRKLESDPLFVQWIEDYVIDDFKSFKADI